VTDGRFDLNRSKDVGAHGTSPWAEGPRVII
jgi:hypothetical protein